MSGIFGGGDKSNILTWAKTVLRAIRQRLTTSKMFVGASYWYYFKAMDDSCMLALCFDGFDCYFGRQQQKRYSNVGKNRFTRHSTTPHDLKNVRRNLLLVLF